MKKMPTRTAEKVYDVLQRFAEASPYHYEKETFIFHYGVLDSTDIKFELKCVDDGLRTFYCRPDGDMWVTGKATGKVNAILRKISEELKDFNLTQAQAQYV